MNSDEEKKLLDRVKMLEKKVKELMCNHCMCRKYAMFDECCKCTHSVQLDTPREAKDCSFYYDRY